MLVLIVLVGTEITAREQGGQLSVIWAGKQTPIPRRINPLARLLFWFRDSRLFCSASRAGENIDLFPPMPGPDV